MREKEGERSNRGPFQALIVLALFFPWVLPYSPLPFTSFYREWSAVLLFGGALLVSAEGIRPRALLNASILPVLLAIAGALLLQVSMDLDLWPKALQVFAYLVLFGTTYLLGNALTLVSGRRALELLFSTIFAIALISCMIGALQLGFGDEFYPFVAPRIYASVYGNIAQANHFADLLWLAVLALGALHAKRRVRFSIAIAALIALVSFSVFSASRSVWLYALVVGATGLFCRTNRFASDDVSTRRALGRVYFAAPLLLPLLYCIYTYSGFLAEYDLGASISRMAGDVQGNATRGWLWWCGMLAAMQHPFLGVGAGRFAGFSAALAMTTPGAPQGGADVNAHNLVLQVAAEMGIPAALTLLWSVYSGFRRALQIRRTFVLVVLGMFAIILTHSCLEFPLWYIYFLGLYGLLLGVLEAEARPQPVGHARRFGYGLGAVILVVAFGAYQQFRHLEAAMQGIVVQVGVGGTPLVSSSIARELDSIPSWSPYRDAGAAIALMAANPKAPDATRLANSCDKIATFQPSAYLLARCSALKFSVGDIAGAELFGEQLCKLYPMRVDELGRSYSLALTESNRKAVPRFSCVSYRD
jgi:hypothetical protein